VIVGSRPADSRDETGVREARQYTLLFGAIAQDTGPPVPLDRLLGHQLRDVTSTFLSTEVDKWCRACGVCEIK
jgi:hypothetical protein